MKFATQYRVSVSATGTVDLEMTLLGGGTETYRLSARAAGQMGRYLREFTSATTPRATQWEPSRYQAEVGPNGGWDIRLTSSRKLGIVMKAPGGLQFEYDLPAEDAAVLIQQLQTVLQLLSDTAPKN